MPNLGIQPGPHWWVRRWVLSPLCHPCTPMPMPQCKGTCKCIHVLHNSSLKTKGKSVRISTLMRTINRWIRIAKIKENILTERDNFGLWALGVATWIHLQTSKSSPAILWLSTLIRDSFPLKKRTALFQAPINLCLFLRKKAKLFKCQH